MKRAEILKRFAQGASSVEDGNKVHYPSTQGGKVAIDTYRRTETGWICHRKGW